MDGWEFLTEFRKLNSTAPKKIPIYIVSSSIANEDFEKSKTFPEIIDYLSKPVELETLETILNF
jgi:CheY-like chemotaxis protein